MTGHDVNAVKVEYQDLQLKVVERAPGGQREPRDQMRGQGRQPQRRQDQVGRGQRHPGPAKAICSSRSTPRTSRNRPPTSGSPATRPNPTRSPRSKTNPSRRAPSAWRSSTTSGARGHSQGRFANHCAYPLWQSCLSASLRRSRPLLPPPLDTFAAQTHEAPRSKPTLIFRLV